VCIEEGENEMGRCWQLSLVQFMGCFVFLQKKNIKKKEEKKREEEQK